MRRMIPMIVLFPLAFSLHAHAQECAPSDETQMCLNVRAEEAHKAEDAKLNKAYHEIMGRLADSHEDKALLQAAQRAWIAFRDAECAFATNHSQDGSIYPLLLSECKAELTKARVAQLGAYLNCEEGDMSCPVPPAQ
ncbi:MAG: DUF1311 domain-containing protein [Rhizobiaceae bacterium]|nr:DUF1311 domain-containing protein [Rhizobiaceae bacterium]